MNSFKVIKSYATLKTFYQTFIFCFLFQAVFALALVSAVAAGHIQPSGYKVEVQHAHAPAPHYGGHQEYVQAAVHAPAAYAGYGGEVAGGYESYGAGAGHDDGHGHEDYFAHPAYKFEYGVKDPKTGDHKSAWEHRDGDKVVGEYSLDEADGTKRIVSYTADDKNGFNAIVKKIGTPHHAPAHYAPAYHGQGHESGHY